MSWEYVQLGELGRFVNGRAFKPTEWTETGLPIIRIQNLNDPDKPYNCYDGDCEERYRVRKGDILISWSASLGVFVWEGGDAWLNQHIFKAIPNEHLIDRRYFIRAVGNALAEMERRVHGATMRHIVRGEFESIPIALPPLPEQRCIVEILEPADYIRTLRRKADAVAQRILPALFYRMFGDPAKNENGREFETLGSLSILGPQYGANAKAVEWRQGLPRYIRITDIIGEGCLSNQDIKSLDGDDWGEFLLEEGDIVFARSGATVGKTYMHRKQVNPCVFAGYLIRFRIDRKKVNPWVVFGLTQTPYYQNWVLSRKRTAAQPNINGQEYASLMIPVPPRDIQEEFARCCEELVQLQEWRRQSRLRAENSFETLLHKAFTGELTARWEEENRELLLGKNLAT